MSAKKSVSEQKRQAIIEAAIKEFRKNGFKVTSMDRISATAKVSKRTVYNHFPSKEQLFQEIFKQLIDFTHKITARPYDPKQSIEKQLLAFALSELRLLATKRFRDLARVMLAESIHSPQLTTKAFAQLNQQEQGLQAFLAAAIADQKLQAVDVDYAARQFLGLIKGCAFWPQVLLAAPEPDPLQSQTIAADAVLMFMSRYGVVGE